jgi:hypothetical protein
MEMNYDVTKGIERLTLFEEQQGVSLDSMYAVFHANTGYLEITGELHLTEGKTKLEKDIDVRVAAYDEFGRVIGTTAMTYFKHKFFGFEIMHFGLSLPIIPSKIRVFPKES